MDSEHRGAALLAAHEDRAREEARDGSTLEMRAGPRDDGRAGQAAEEVRRGTARPTVHQLREGGAHGTVEGVRRAQGEQGFGGEGEGRGRGRCMRLPSAWRAEPSEVERLVRAVEERGAVE